MKFYLGLGFALMFSIIKSQSINSVPAVLSGFSLTNSQLSIFKNGQQLKDLEKKDMYTLSQMLGDATGTETGIQLDFKKTGFNGSIAYGPLNTEAEFPTVSFLGKPLKLVDGKVLLEIKKTFKGVNDFFRLAEKGQGVLGYRVMDSDGRIIYEGRVAFAGKGPYTVVPTLTEGPLVNNLTETGSVISFETQVPVKTSITVNSKTFSDPSPTTHHEISVDGLLPSTNYKYTVSYGDRTDSHNFKTAAKSGSRKPFSFAFAGANRATLGGGERDFGGTNYQSSRAIISAALMSGAKFMQATGDITNGGNPSEDGHLMEYANWKRALEPFWSMIPVYTGFGDHEVNFATFSLDTITKKFPKIDRFPYATESGEATFARAFVHPLNGPESEDGASYDPSSQMDFPPYKENVYFYTYDNIVMIVLNTEYWKAHDPNVSGCPEGYIMDQQLKWLNETVQHYENDPAIDHIFVNVHSAVFPNGDHASGAMWYNGNNAERAIVAGNKVTKGIIERRDEVLDICVNRSKKFLAFLSADEHNFAFLEIKPDFPLYPQDYKESKLKLNRSFYHINNGCGGSAPYAMLATPWSSNFRFFTEPPAVALIDVSGKSVKLRAFNAETFGKICEDVKLR